MVCFLLAAVGVCNFLRSPQHVLIVYRVSSQLRMHIKSQLITAPRKASHRYKHTQRRRSLRRRGDDPLWFISRQLFLVLL